MYNMCKKNKKTHSRSGDNMVRSIVLSCIIQDNLKVLQEILPGRVLLLQDVRSDFLQVHRPANDLQLQSIKNYPMALERKHAARQKEPKTLPIVSAARQSGTVQQLPEVAERRKQNNGTRKTPDSNRALHSSARPAGNVQHMANL